MKKQQQNKILNNGNVFFPHVITENTCSLLDFFQLRIKLCFLVTTRGHSLLCSTVQNKYHIPKEYFVEKML